MSAPLPFRRPTLVPDTLPDHVSLGAAQAADVAAMLAQPAGEVVRWPWRGVSDLLGGLLPGQLHVVGALTGNGKSSFLMSLMHDLASNGIGVLYLPLEVSPPIARVRWAAWKLGYNVADVLERCWHDHPDPSLRLLPEGAREAINLEVERQLAEEPVHFCPLKRINVSGIRRWAEWGCVTYDARVVIVDHLHRLEVGDQPNALRQLMTEAARQLPDMAEATGTCVIAAAQLTRNNDPLDRYFPPTLDRLKECGAIAEEAHTVTMLSRRFTADVDNQMVSAMRASKMVPPERIKPGAMQITCRKHRTRDHATDRAALLRVTDGRVTDWGYEEVDA